MAANIADLGLVGSITAKEDAAERAGWQMEHHQAMGDFGFLAFGIVSLTLGVVLGALTERARARSGYLSRQYREHLLLFVGLLDAYERGDTSKQARLENALNESRQGVDTDVRLFGKRHVKPELDRAHVCASSESTTAEELAEIVSELAEVFRGGRFSRLSPQREWFVGDGGTGPSMVSRPESNPGKE